MIQVDIETIDRTDLVVWNTLRIEQNLTSLADKANFAIRKYGSRIYTPEIGEEVEIYDGATKIFGGSIISINEEIETGIDGIAYEVECVDYTYDLDSIYVSRSYENETIQDIIADILTDFTDGSFTSANATSAFVIERIVFNQVPISTALKRLASIVRYEWYVDVDKDIHFFPKFTETAPFDLTDISGNYVYKSLARKIDGSQITNRVLVRGGEYDGSTFTDVITVKGNDTLSFKLPYKFSNLVVELDTGGGYVNQDILIDFIDDFSGGGNEVLYNFQERTIRFENALSDGDMIQFSGNPKVPVLAVAEDAASIAQYGIKTKLLRDSSIEDLTTARQRATAELETYKDKIEDGSFQTYESGLRAGMVINLTSTIRDCDTDFIIKQLTMRPQTKETFVYSASIVTTRKYGLIELLQSILEPEPLQADSAEVAEIIKTDSVEIHIEELIEVVEAYEDFATLSILEEVEKDPLGADTVPIFVLAPYFPSDFDDPKRVGLLDRSLIVY